jgi:hypothetical protein
MQLWFEAGHALNHTNFMNKNIVADVTVSLPLQARLHR